MGVPGQGLVLTAAMIEPVAAITRRPAEKPMKETKLDLRCKRLSPFLWISSMGMTRL